MTLNPDFVIITQRSLESWTFWPSFAYYRDRIAKKRTPSGSFRLRTVYVLSYQMRNRIQFPVYPLPFLNIAHVPLASRLPSVPL